MLNYLGCFIQGVCKGFRSAGVLVFFPSYGLLAKCRSLWRDYDFGMFAHDEPKGQAA